GSFRQFRLSLTRVITDRSRPPWRAGGEQLRYRLRQVGFATQTCFDHGPRLRFAKGGLAERVKPAGSLQYLPFLSGQAGDGAALALQFAARVGYLMFGIGIEPSSLSAGFGDVAGTEGFPPECSCDQGDKLRRHAAAVMID